MLNLFRAKVKKQLRWPALCSIARRTIVVMSDFGLIGLDGKTRLA